MINDHYTPPDLARQFAKDALRKPAASAPTPTIEVETGSVDDLSEEDKRERKAPPLTVTIPKDLWDRATDGAALPGSEQAPPVKFVTLVLDEVDEETVKPAVPAPTITDYRACGSALAVREHHCRSDTALIRWAVLGRGYRPLEFRAVQLIRGCPGAGRLGSDRRLCHPQRYSATVREGCACQPFEKAASASLFRADRTGRGQNTWHGPFRCELYVKYAQSGIPLREARELTETALVESYGLNKMRPAKLSRRRRSTKESYEHRDDHPKQ